MPTVMLSYPGATGQHLQAIPSTPEFPPGDNAPGTPPAHWMRLRRFVGPALIVAAVVLAVIVVWQGRSPSPPGEARGTGGAPPSAATAFSGTSVRVHVTGAVANPGVHGLRVGDRVEDAIRAAGGLTDNADTTALNLAVRIRDEQRVDIPSKRTVSGVDATVATTGPTVPTARSGPSTDRSGTAHGGAVRPAPTATPIDDLQALLADPSTPDGHPRVNINQASAADLERLPGFGSVSVQRVIAYRSAHGPVQTVANLREAGISTAILRRALPYLSLG